VDVDDQAVAADFDDTRRVMKCCLAHILPSGRVVPFCAYNMLATGTFLCRR